MDKFEESVGYRSIWMNAEPTRAEVAHKSAEQIVQLAKDLFDFRLAEILRGSGEWHWEFDEDRIGDIASEVAEQISKAECEGDAGCDEQGEWDALYTLLLTHYGEQYRTPSMEELKTARH
jgi:hypothetical protein